ncbi:MAG: glycosyltransferase family 4 protein [Flavobacteriaceae bacterium]|nr:glycosyltransferase family 4 protein [Flavobacteriaceae bacterium]
MKIGAVLSNPPGYSETFFTSKIKGLQENSMEVILFVGNYKEEFKLCKVYKAPKVYKNYPLLQFLLTFWEFIKLLPNIKAVIKFIKLEKQDSTSLIEIYKKIYLNSHILKQKVDWLHFGFATQALGSELVAKAIGAKMAVSFRGFDINVYPVKHLGCYQKVWKNVNKVHSISNYLLQKAYSLGLSPEVPFKIITPAVNLKQFKNLRPTTYDLRPKIVTIARLNWIKGLDVSIAAMKLLKEKGIDFSCHIIGSGNKGDEERYKFQVHQLGLKENVVFEGKRSHKETLQILSEATIYLQPSLNEGFCNAVLEAQALGKLCIVSGVGGLPENIENNKTGWLVPKSNPEALVNKIVEVLHLPESKKQEIAKNAQERVRKQFTIEQQQKQFVAFFEC